MASLRAVLEAPLTPAPVEYRSVTATPALAIRERVAAADMVAWWAGAFQDLRKALDVLLHLDLCGLQFLDPVLP